MAIEEENATNFVSIASLWEMAIKISLGKLELKMPFDHIEQQIAANGFEILPITLQDILTVSTLPFHHRDPFDRIIIAQSLNNDMIVISKDKFFDQYQAKVRW
jgi:PIN domain nuclease of toxin-antitoxin system